jgi:hypothetical protein
MKNFRSFALATVCVLALPLAALAADPAPAPAPADKDAAFAAKLVGSWEGRWEFANAGGRLTVTISAAKGNALEGKSVWYETVAGDFADTFTSATVKERKLKVGESTMDFTATVSEDGLSMEGKWSSPMASGPLKLKKKAE